MADGTRINELRERVARLEDFVGAPVSDSAVAISVHLERIEANVLDLKNEAEERSKLEEKRWETVMADMCSFADAFKERMQIVDDEIALVKRALNSGSSSSGEHSQKIKVPDPKPFAGARDSKELENFLWDMEQYFKAAHVPQTEMVTITTMYLSSDAKLWWRTRSEDDTRPIIVTWELMKKELRAQFLPTNAAWVARRNLKELQHTDTVREYVKQFSSLMLDIKNMSEEDRLFNFISGLQPWAQTELRRQGVCDLTGAMAAADCLVDYKLDGNARTSKASRFEKDKGKGKGKQQEEDKGEKDSEKSQPNSSVQSSKGSNFKSGCFICEGPHRARDCPTKERLNAIVAEDQEDSDLDEPRLSGIQLCSLQIMGCEDEDLFGDCSEMLEAESEDLVLETPRTSSGFGGGGLLPPN